MNEPQPIPRKVPDYMRSKGGIWFWTGAMIMVIFFYEVITGLILFFYYQPSNAYTSTENVLTLPYGTVILTTHLYGAYLMIGLVYLHLIRNMIVGSYKHPREMQWLSGVLLLILTVAVAYFGYSMTGDVLSSDATDVGRGIAGAVPFIGSYLSSIVLGNGTSLSLFSRLEGWHILLAGSILLLFAVHFYLAEYNTIMPKAEDVNFNVPAIDKDKPSYKPWYPYNLLYMIQVALFSVEYVYNGTSQYINATLSGNASNNISVIKGQGWAVSSMPWNNSYGGWEVTHTFTILQQGQIILNVPTFAGTNPSGGAITTAQFYLNNTGTYTWQCFVPCGDELNGWGGAMATAGWMTGVVEVVS